MTSASILEALFAIFSNDTALEIFLIAYVVLHVWIAVAIAQDAKRLHDTYYLFIPQPALWFYASLILGPVIVPFYWLFQHSSFIRSR